jgi:type II secretory ATPase GspE/PulE/Tfp pilus assembly ATPase PilB-like protein
MKVDAILELSDRRRLEVNLAKPFMPEDSGVDVLVKGSTGMQKFLFPEICCLLMKHNAKGMFANLQNTSQEDVTTIIGNTYQVFVSEEHSFSTGFFGLSVKQDIPHRLIFFPTFGVKVRCQTKAVGEILQSQGQISADSIQNALSEQQKLKKRLLGEIISEANMMPRSVVEDTLKEAYKSGKIPRGAKIGEILVTVGLISQEQVDHALAIKEKNKKRKIGELLMELGHITEESLLAALAAKFRIDMLDLSNFVPNMKALEALPYDVVYRLNVFPVMDKGDRLVVATSQPTDYSIEEHLRFYTGRRIEMVIATSKQISEAIEKYYHQEETGAETGMDDLLGELLADQEIEVEEETEASGLSESDSAIVNLVNKFLFDAYNRGASDIHFEPGIQDQPSQIRYRVDGICAVMHQIPKLYKKAIISRLKIMAALDITERRKPQSGKILLRSKTSRIEYRLEITPTTGGNEDAVLRILASSKPLPLEQMGFSDSNLKAFQAALSQPYGIILCVGPTGSGKTTTLHSALARINTPDRKIWTAEDPVEITQRGLRQVQIHSKIGLTFAEVLRSFLRADPDVIMIGEMRDSETAKIAIEASLTGHLVLSTLHTNSAPETIVRLIEMGMDPFNFADAMLSIIAQRLARRLCDYCKKPYLPTEDEFSELVHLYGAQWFKEHNMEPYSRDVRFMKKEGCEKCNGTGYKGRLALHELAAGTEKLKKAIKNEAHVEELRILAVQEGMRTLLMDGIQKIFQGLTDVNQVLRVCSSQTIGDV